MSVLVKRCPHPEACRAETNYGTGATECDCGLIGWLGVDGEIYNVPRYPEGKLAKRDPNDCNLCCQFAVCLMVIGFIIASVLIIECVTGVQ